MTICTAYNENNGYTARLCWPKCDHVWVSEFFEKYGVDISKHDVRNKTVNNNEMEFMWFHFNEYGKEVFESFFHININV